MELTSKKAMLHGFIAGDGNIDMRRERKVPTTKHYEIRFYPDHKVLADLFISTFDEVYGKKPNIMKTGFKHHGCYCVRKCYKEAALDLTSIGPLGTYNWRVPFNFLKNDDSKIAWIRSFFDAEAYVNTSTNKTLINVQSVNEQGLKDLKKLLSKVGIVSSRIYKYERKQEKWNTNYILVIMRKNEVKKYFDNIGFNHPIKMNKLKDAGVAEW